MTPTACASAVTVTVRRRRNGRDAWPERGRLFCFVRSVACLLQVVWGPIYLLRVLAFGSIFMRWRVTSASGPGQAATPPSPFEAPACVGTLAGDPGNRDLGDGPPGSLAGLRLGVRRPFKLTRSLLTRRGRAGGPRAQAAVVAAQAPEAHPTGPVPGSEVGTGGLVRRCHGQGQQLERPPRARRGRPWPGPLAVTPWSQQSGGGTSSVYE